MKGLVIEKDRKKIVRKRMRLLRGLLEAVRRKVCFQMIRNGERSVAIF